jgi:hypothetical protein
MISGRAMCGQDISITDFIIAQVSEITGVAAEDFARRHR